MNGDDLRFDTVAELVLEDRLVDARDLLDDITIDGARRRDPLVTGRALRLGASLSRLLGDPDGGIERLQDALAIPDLPTDLRRELTGHLGDLELMAGHHAAAADDYERALLLLPDDDGIERSSILQRRATALHALGHTAEGVALLEEAGRLARTSGDAIGEVLHLVQLATSLEDRGSPEAAAVAAAASRQAEQTGDLAALAQLSLLDASRALRDGDTDEALIALDDARGYALDAVVPHVYVGAAIATSRLANAVGERERAYRSLAVGWVTLGDLLGADLAQATFEEEMRSLRDEWGAAAFRDVKASYEHRRRAETGGGTGSGG